MQERRGRLWLLLSNDPGAQRMLRDHNRGVEELPEVDPREARRTIYSLVSVLPHRPAWILSRTLAEVRSFDQHLNTSSETVPVRLATSCEQARLQDEDVALFLHKSLDGTIRVRVFRKGETPARVTTSKPSAMRAMTLPGVFLISTQQIPPQGEEDDTHSSGIRIARTSTLPATEEVVRSSHTPRVVFRGGTRR